MNRAIVVSLAIIFASALALPLTPVTKEPSNLLSLREQSVEINTWLNERVNVVLPQLMREYNVDLWLLSMLEYAEDTVFWSLKFPTRFFGRRRTVIVLYNGPDGMKRHDLVGLYQGEFEQAVDLIRQYNPRTIALNVDRTFAWSDGLHSGEQQNLLQALGDFRSRVVYQPLLAVDYVSTRVPAMLPRYQQIMEIVHLMISTAFSAQTITPGVTTTDDVVWWFRDYIQDLGLTTWFQPSVEAVRNPVAVLPGVASNIIQKGDMLWCDVGIVYMGLATDTQHLGYVLRDGETEPPQGLKDGLKTSNRMQEILINNMVVGLTGNDILANTLQDMKSESINGLIYSHPIGDQGHGAGAIIGLFDMQGGVPDRGDVKMRNSMWYSIELSATKSVPEWGGIDVVFRQEEDVFVDAKGVVDWVYKRQSEFHLVK
eukprot:TRINITY_DN15853_c0_g1_i1.p1 TRINITY_DN15853_c0_g1~~TRINITY_DN15853_c0_g1_i1.p1  ORF type:complete len:427 (-),score=91.21 TRINITY_DN15853_c0_g1_i1:210-1490(-)